MKRLLILFIQLLKRPYLIFRHNHVPLSACIINGARLHRCTIGKYSYVSRGVGLTNVLMGNYCSVGPQVIIGGMEHSYWAISTSTHLSDECISNKITTIGHDVWIGANAVIRQGITIGNGAVIGAGSIVTKDVPENTIVCGSPARFLKKRMDDEIWEKIKESRYWEEDKQKALAIIKKIRF